MTVIKKMAAAVGTIALTIGGVLFVAPAAHADADGCVEFLAEHGYNSANLRGICQATADGSIDTGECVQEMLPDDVDAASAFQACVIAAD
ncbi:hypothetical protein ACGFZB_25215 [Streptomyces cinerochromogenes]|uniref:Secreted protein n=1 Tax=Streptomyces cinerochromogenes TaxID=66422 RepID=A0ABW7B929_9ACTN